MGKGFAIGSAALTALALFVSYAQAVGLFESGINLLDYKVIVGMFVGGMLPFLFSAFTMDSVSKAAYKMIEEVRRQFKTIPGILEGKGKPDYTSCVAISTQAALKEMLLPGVMAVLAPLFIGVVLGPAALGGLLGGALVTGVMLAIFMSNPRMLSNKSLISSLCLIPVEHGITRRNILKMVIMVEKEAKHIVQQL